MEKEEKNTQEEQNNTITVDDAIKISKVLCQAPEERIPMILSVLEKAQVNIDGLDSLEEWKAFKDMNALIDIEDFMEDVRDKFKPEGEGDIFIPTEEFNSFCREKKLKPTPVKRLLAKKEFIKTSSDKDRIHYSVSHYEEEKTKRCVCFFRKAWDREE